MNIRRPRCFCIEICKTLNDVNPSFMKEISRDRYKLNLNIPRRNQVIIGAKSLKFYGPKIWNTQPINIKTVKDLNAFKYLMKLHCLHSSMVYF